MGGPGILGALIMKRVLGGLLVLILVVAVAGYFLMANLGPLVKAAVENYGSEILGVPVTVESVEISAETGEGLLRGLVIGNPAGFSSPSAFQLGEIKIALDAGSLTGNPFIVESIAVADPKITYEISQEGSNINAILANARAYQASSGGGGNESTDDEGTKLIVDDLLITGGKIAVSASFLKGAGLSARLPDIHMTEIGRDSDGATPGEFTEAVLGEISGKAGGAVSALNNEQISNAMSKGKAALKKGTDKVKKGLKKLFGD